MITTNQIHWVAAILEGEGYFGIGNNSPRIQLAMTDLDVVEKAKNLLDNTKIISSHSAIECKDGSIRKTRYSLTLTGNIAIQWMMTIYSLMGLRRKTKIREILFYWKKRDSKKELFAQDKMIKVLMEVKKLSREEAEKQLLENIFIIKK